MPVDVILIHGVEAKLGDHYYDDFVLALRRKLPVEAEINFHPVNWSLLLEEKEKLIFSWMDSYYKRLAWFGCMVASDVLAYANTKRMAEKGDFYFDILALLDAIYEKIHAKTPRSKVAVVAHSQGTQIALDWLWGKPADLFVSMGSPILYGSVRFKDFGFPPPNLSRWINIRNRFDPISTPINKNPNFNWVEDFIVKSWNPIHCLPIRAHTYYWKSEAVINKITNCLIELNETKPVVIPPEQPHPDL